MPEFSIPEGTKIGHIHMEASDIENDKNFYVEKLGLNIVSEIPKAYFLSVDGYHHHFGMNQWNGMRKMPKNTNSTGVEEIYATMDKEKFEENFLIKDGNKAVVQLPNGIKLIVNAEQKKIKYMEIKDFGRYEKKQSVKGIISLLLLKL